MPSSSNEIIEFDDVADETDVGEVGNSNDGFGDSFVGFGDGSDASDDVSEKNIGLCNCCRSSNSIGPRLLQYSLSISGFAFEISSKSNDPSSVTSPITKPKQIKVRGSHSIGYQVHPNMSECIWKGHAVEIVLPSSSVLSLVRGSDLQASFRASKQAFGSFCHHCSFLSLLLSDLEKLTPGGFEHVFFGQKMFKKRLFKTVGR